MTKIKKEMKIKEKAEDNRIRKIQRIRNRSNVLRDQRLSLSESNDKFDLITMDLEASSLSSESYPIEVAIIAYKDKKEILSFSTLIKPTDEWINHGDWNDESANIHKIKKEELNAGLEPWQICEILDNILVNQNVMVDSQHHDKFWILRLYEGRLPTFTMETISNDNIMKLNAIESNIIIAHRALPDARWLGENLLKMSNYSE